MSELQSLWLVLAVIYLSECAVWLRRGSVAFARFFGLAWQVWHPGTVLGNHRGSLVLANPLPPLDAICLGRQPAVSISPDAAFSYVAASLNPGWRGPQPARFIRFADFRSVEREGRKLRINGELFLSANSTFSARQLAGQLRRLQTLPPEKRAAAIQEMLRESLDTAKISARWKDYQTCSKTLRRLTNGLFVYLFVMAPLLIWQLGWTRLAWVLAAGLLAQTITIAFLFRRAHLALYPGAAEERFTPFATMLLAPPTAIRAHDLLARPLFENFHPLAVARVLGAPVRFEGFARGVLLDLRFPLLPPHPTAAPEPIQCEEWFRKTLLAEIEHFLRRAGLAPEKLTQPPTPSESGNRSYCPRCETQFSVAEGVCAECGGWPLRRFDRAPDTTSC